MYDVKIVGERCLSRNFSLLTKGYGNGIIYGVSVNWRWYLEKKIGGDVGCDDAFIRFVRL
jgi:hypothetical protein